MPELNVAEIRATVARLEERISIEQRKKRDRDAVHGDRSSDADDRDAYHHDWAAFRKQAAEDAYRELPALLAAVKALLEDKERLDLCDRLVVDKVYFESREEPELNPSSRGFRYCLDDLLIREAARAKEGCLRRDQHSPTRSEGESSRSSD